MLLAILQESNGEYSVLSFGAPKTLFPNVSFRRGEAPNQDFLDEHNAVIVDESWRPTIDTATQYLREVSPYVESGQNVVTYTAIDYTEEELIQVALIPYEKAKYSAFWQELIRSNVYAALKSAAKADLAANVMATELISLFSDAKAGNVDVEAMQQGIWETVAALNNIDSALVTSLSALMVAYGLDVYTLAPPAA